METLVFQEAQDQLEHKVLPVYKDLLATKENKDQPVVKAKAVRPEEKEPR